MRSIWVVLQFYDGGDGENLELEKTRAFTTKKLADAYCALIELEPPWSFDVSEYRVHDRASEALEAEGIA